MADEAATETTSSSNGVSPSRADQIAADRAAFLAGAKDDADPADEVKAESPKREVADDDSDLDGDEKADSDADVEPKADDDSDLDEDDDKAENEDDEDDEKQVDPDTAKRLSQVRRADKRLREQRDRDFKAREQEVDARAKEHESRLTAELERWRPRVEAAERFEKLSSRVNVDPLGVLQALGLQEDRYEHAAQVLYTLAKAKDDPKARVAAAQLMKDRERDDEVADLKKWREEREKADKEREEHAAADAHWGAFFSRVESAVSDKTPLARAFLKANPTEARDRITVLTYKLAKEAGGTQPKERDVTIALEKDRRRILRDLGIDPKSLSAAKANATIESNGSTKSKSAPSKVEKKTAKLKADDDSAPISREDFVALGGKFD